MSLIDLPESGPLPWNSRPYSYAGWVPTISGHLSFSLIGTDDLRPRCQTYNKPIPNTNRRIIIVHQRRISPDYPYPKWFVALRHPAAVQHYLLIANTSAALTHTRVGGRSATIDDIQGVLAGTVMILPRNRDSVTRKKGRELLSRLDSLLNDDETPPQIILEEVNSAVLRAHLDGILMLSLDFALFRTGEFRLWYDLKSFLGREVHGQAVPPSKKELESADTVAPHAYYFVKDITHRHYHHDPESDQLLLLSRLDEVTKIDDHQENELKWRRETLWGLVRISAQFRRQKRLDDHKRARGIIAYADAFQSSLAMIWRSDRIEGEQEEHGKLFLYDFGHTKASVQSVEDVASWQQAGLMQFVAVMVAIFLSSLALWGTAIQLRPILCQAPESTAPASVNECPPLNHSFSTDISLWVAEQPLAFISILLVLGFATFSIFIKTPRFFRPARWFHIGLAKFAWALGATTARGARNRAGNAADWVGYVATMAFLATLLAALARVAIAFLI